MPQTNNNCFQNCGPCSAKNFAWMILAVSWFLAQVHCAIKESKSERLWLKAPGRLRPLHCWHVNRCVQFVHGWDGKGWAISHSLTRVGMCQMIYSSVRMHQARPGTVSFVSFLLPPFDTSICLFVRLSVCRSVCFRVHTHFIIAIMSNYTHHSSSEYSAHQITCALQLHYIIAVLSTVHCIFLTLRHYISFQFTAPCKYLPINVTPSESLVFCVRKALFGRVRFNSDVLLRFVSPLGHQLLLLHKHTPWNERAKQC